MNQRLYNSITEQDKCLQPAAVTNVNASHIYSLQPITTNSATGNTNQNPKVKYVDLKLK